MPDVVGKKQADAKQASEDQGFKVTVKTRESSKANEGKVIEQSIEKGKKVDKGTTVTIYVGKVKEETEEGNGDNNSNSNTEKPNTNTDSGKPGGTTYDVTEGNTQTPEE